MQIISDAGIDFITAPGRDSFVSKPYQDSGGLWTIGYGEQITPEIAAAFKAGITEEVAKKHLLVWFSQFYSSRIGRLFDGHRLMQHQVDAIYSLVYNIGVTAFIDSTIYHRLLAQSIDLTPWLWFIKDAKGAEQPGLVKRRHDELRLFIYGCYS